jgi:hypothetical protein
LDVSAAMKEFEKAREIQTAFSLMNPTSQGTTV